jgi:hypothetical protein
MGPPQIRQKKLNSFLLFCMIPHIILGRNVFQRLIETVFGEMNGKTKTPTQGGQQEEAGPLEGSTQNQLTGRLDVKSLPE